MYSKKQISLKKNIVENKSELTLDSLLKLFNNQICALRIPNFCSKLICNKMSSWLLSYDQLAPCLNEIRKNDQVKYLDYGVDSNSICFNTTYYKDSDSVEYNKYYQNALINIRKPRDIISPKIPPIDRLRLELDELWPQGAMIANFNKLKNTVGLFRVVEAARSHLLSQSPHVDSLPVLYKNLVSQFTANIYFTIPDSGGELEVWDIDPLSNKSIDECQFIPNWREILPKPLIVKPECGDLILFNARKPHAVSSFKEGKRISVQCFIGIEEDKKLLLWS